MDYQNRAGSKKGAGGIASDAQQNLNRRKQVDELLRGDEEVPYTFQDISEDKEEANGVRNPYIYKNHSGKLICKLCNTMHMSWSSVERHLGGKKHGLNLLRRSGTNTSVDDNFVSEQEKEFQAQVDELRAQIKHNGVVPECRVIKVRHPVNGNIGIAVRVDYNTPSTILTDKQEPYLRIVSGVELPGTDNDDKKYLIVAFEPFENIAIEIPNKDIELNEVQGRRLAVDEINRRGTYWDTDEKAYYIQLFFVSS
ncbi:HBR161Wp [Eremothecium sinecaudum]|uniref:HBR161Wp n=1 Tax=Eremothecium sinecaudum TaxID=45286 RepID=A0A109UXD7_9SACH|nr:HBR161Wp [Eremothecium sinecaudum]AMD19062.1 HBR161Wp [Eremothecium sinecaudum]